MHVCTFIQHSKEWHEHRITARNASEASVIMGASPNVSRDDLIRCKVLGNEEDLNEFVLEVVFPKGHEVEALARPIIEKQFNLELFQVVATDDEGYLSASFDGATLDQTTIWECKQFNQGKAVDVEAGRIPECDFWQVAQQMRVGQADRLIYTVSDGTEENTHSVIVNPAYFGDAFSQLEQAWRIFDSDMLKFKHAPQPLVIGLIPQSLPALIAKVEGSLFIDNNLEDFKTKALAVFTGCKLDLVTDQDFADAEKIAKHCKDIETRIELLTEQLIWQIPGLSEFLSELEDIKTNQAERLRKLLDKAVKNKKDSIKSEAREGAENELRAFCESNDTPFTADMSMRLGAAMKNKRTTASLIKSLGEESARIKAELLSQLNEAPREPAPLKSLDVAVPIKEYVEMLELKSLHERMIAHGLKSAKAYKLARKELKAMEGSAE